jgi:hypothetical protein
MTQPASPCRNDARLVIRGVTVDGKPFRPSDWAQRLASMAGRIDRGRRLRLDPRVSNTIVEGTNSLVLDPHLQEEQPETFEFLLKFARSNRLVILECPAGELCGPHCHASSY